MYGNFKLPYTLIEVWDNICFKLLAAVSIYIYIYIYETFFSKKKKKNHAVYSGKGT